MKATGTPVKVMVILTESDAANIHQTTTRAGVTAAVKAINEVGNGLGGSGHPIDLVFCSTGLDPNKANACASKAANDPSFVATAGNLVTENVYTVLDKAGLPSIPAGPNQDIEYKSPNIFLTNGGIITGQLGQGAVAYKNVGAKKINELQLGLPAGDHGTQILNRGLKALGASTLNRVVVVPLTAADVSSYVASGSQGADAVIVVLAATAYQQALVARQAQGITVPYVSTSIGLSSDVLKNLGPATDGLALQAFYPTDDIDLPGNSAYIEQMKAAGQGANLNSDGSKGSWAAFDLLNVAAKGLTTLDRTTMLGALNKVSNYDAGGLTPSLDFTKPGPNAEYPRIMNWSYFHAKVDDGKVVSAGSGKLEPLPTKF